MLARLIHKLSLRFWRLGQALNRLTTLPVIGPVAEAVLFSKKENQGVILPVNETIYQGEQVALPVTLLPTLIERASRRVVLNHCLCRQAESCQTYPTDFGCLFLGEGAARIDATLGHAVTVDAAMSHVEKALDLGLVPMVMHSACDAFMLQIPFRRMLAICFCCDCCCTIRQTLRLNAHALSDTILRLPGLEVQVGDACVGCGLCITRCPVKAITLVEGQAQIDNARCKGCGLCVSTCPSEAISLHVDPETDVAARLLALVEARTEI
ncbi:MAG: 4Fe-4S binding protein [Anaerolineae bacterium]|nr:4Fe-4S binding protein [Anaerolineae bacterium]